MTTHEYLWALVIAAILATYVWRFLGALFAQRINPQGLIFQWVTCVSYAMLAGLIARMVFIPVGPLVATPMWVRVTGMIVGIAVFFAAGRIVLVGVGAGLAVFIMLISSQT